MDAVIKNNESAGRFELIAGGSLAFIEYRMQGQTMILVHTKVPKELEGQGIGGKIVKFALEHAKENSLEVLPECPFAKSYIERHEEYQDLVAE